MPYQQMYVRVHLLMASFLLKQKTSLLFYPSSIRGRSEISVGVNRGSRYEARVKINRRHGTKCTSMYISYLRVCKANTLQTRTTAVRGGSEMLRIFSSGKDAAGLNRNDVSASAETRYQKCTRMYTFDDATK